MLLGYFWLLHRRLILGSKLWLIGGSLFFYSWWNIYYLPLLLLSILVNFFVGSAFTAEKKLKITKKQLFTFGILFNILLLAFFKYTDFFLENFNGIFGQNIPLLHIVLPLGISFFTFTQIAFLIDAYKCKVKEYDLLNYMLFVSYFPHLLAGPILHHAEMMPQFASRWNLAVRWRNISIGIFLFSVGLFKKVVIADTFAQFTNVGFDTAVTLNLIEAWATSLSYTIQLYFDFSGYTDMAIGISLMFNIVLPINFNSPYKAKNIQDFWRRWHITLSRFLRDYIYILLGGNKVSKAQNYFNLLAVFLIGGVWHGAGWTFIAWGALHGVAIVVHRAWQDFGLRIWGWLGWILTFNFINITWVFFRSDDFETVKTVLGGMLGINGIVLPAKLAQKLAILNTYGIEFTESYLSHSGLNGIKDLILIAIMIIFVIIAKNTQELSKSIKYSPLTAVILGLITVCGLIYLNRPSQFLYFQF